MTRRKLGRFPQIALPVAVVLAVMPWSGGRAQAAEAPGMLGTIHRHVMRTTTVPENGDLNPYAVVVAPVSAGKIQKDDVLVDNFNDVSNLQGKGTTIVSYNPATKKTALFAKLPRTLAQCPGGVGLSTAMTMLKTGWVIVGSTPSTDGTTGTKSNGCLLVLDANGQLAAVWSGPDINDPWGNIATLDNGATATLFVSMAGFDVPGPQVHDPAGKSVVVNKAKVVRFELSIAPGQPPQIVRRTVVADGLG
ncbi:MAG: hypothetical protein ACREET_16205, partial [Stellaceae bacterium]